MELIATSLTIRVGSRFLDYAAMALGSAKRCMLLSPLIAHGTDVCRTHRNTILVSYNSDRSENRKPQILTEACY
jgi:hypothetical protein